MNCKLERIVGSFPDLPDCQDPFTERVKEIYRTRERFAHLDRVLRECATSDDPIYRTAAALWEAISGPANNTDESRTAHVRTPQSAGSDGRCPTCRQRNSRVREHETENGAVIVWHCNVKGCANHSDYQNK
jgi:hypothetical protein